MGSIFSVLSIERAETQLPPKDAIIKSYESIIKNQESIIENHESIIAYKDASIKSYKSIIKSMESTIKRKDAVIETQARQMEKVKDEKVDSEESRGALEQRDGSSSSSGGETTSLGEYFLKKPAMATRQFLPSLRNPELANSKSSSPTVQNYWPPLEISLEEESRLRSKRRKRQATADMWTSDDFDAFLKTADHFVLPSRTNPSQELRVFDLLKKVRFKDGIIERSYKRNTLLDEASVGVCFYSLFANPITQLFDQLRDIDMDFVFHGHLQLHLAVPELAKYFRPDGFCQLVKSSNVAQLNIAILIKLNVPWKFPDELLKTDLKSEHTLKEGNLYTYYGSGEGKESKGNNVLAQIRAYLAVNQRKYAIITSVNCFTFVYLDDNDTLRVSERFWIDKKYDDMCLLERLIRFILATANATSDKLTSLPDFMRAFVQDNGIFSHLKPKDSTTVLSPGGENGSGNPDDDLEDNEHGSSEIPPKTSSKAKGSRKRKSSSSKAVQKKTGSATNLKTSQHELQHAKTSSSSGSFSTDDRSLDDIIDTFISDIDQRRPHTWFDLQDPRRYVKPSPLSVEDQLKPMGELEGDAKILSTGRVGSVYMKEFDGIVTVSKLLGLLQSRDKESGFAPDALNAMLRECKAYTQLTSLQGSVIPRLMNCGYLLYQVIFMLSTEWSGDCFDVSEMTDRQKKSALSGLRRIHKLGVLHGDLHEDNLLVKNDTIVFIDFGLARFKDGDGISPDEWSRLCDAEIRALKFLWS